MNQVIRNIILFVKIALLDKVQTFVFAHVYQAGVQYSQDDEKEGCCGGGCGCGEGCSCG